jgi:hypothetical protein
MTDHDAADDLVRFFESLSESERREYDALAKLDAEHGEDVYVGKQRS